MSNQQGFPQISAPIAVQGGNISQPWLQFFITLWNRTGGTQGGATVVPTGVVTSYAGIDPPGGWLVCDGSVVSRNIYSNLFGVIGTTWGAGDGSSTFNLPNLSSKFPIGVSGGHPLASTGGSTVVTLTTSNLASHNHGVLDPGHTHAVTDPGHTHNVTDPGHVHAITDPGHHHTSATPASNGTSGANAVGATAGNTGNSATGITINSAMTGVTNDTNTTGVTNSPNTTGVTTQDTGSAAPFSILPPFTAIYYIIKS